MRVFKSTYRDRTGKVREASKWYIEFKDHLETIRRLPAFTDKKLSEELGRKVEKLVAYRVNNEQPSGDLGRWIETLSPSIRQRLTEIGILDKKRLAASQSLIDHLEDFRNDMAARGITEKQIQIVTSRVKRIFTGCGFRFWSDINAHKVEIYLADLRKPTMREGKTVEGISYQTSNFYLTAIKEFCNWMVRNGRVSQSPVAFLKRLNVRLDRRHDRRALTIDELERLFKAAENGPAILGVSGYERKLIYMTAAGTGFRANELRTLTPECFDLAGTPPTITIEAGYSKHRRQDVQPIRADLADLLRGWIADKPAGQSVFTIPDDPAEMIRRDMVAAGIAYCDPETGLYADFHSLRHTYVSMVIAGGASPRTAMELARHSTPSLTFGRYGHAYLGDLTKSLDSLPSFEHEPEHQGEEMRRTGTDDQPETTDSVLAFCLAPQGEKTRILADSDGKKTLKNSKCETGDSTAYNASKPGFREEEGQARPRGFGPLTFGSVDRCSIQLS